MRIYAIDPGPERSALVVYSPVGGVLGHDTVTNSAMLVILHSEAVADDVLVVEQIAAMGMAVGAEVFETCFWSGRFVECWLRTKAVVWDRVKRHQVKTHLCNSMRAKDANIRQAIIDRFGPGKLAAIGTKARHGPLYGIHGDEWAALAVALTWADTRKAQLQEAS